jgi:hypothetical protein
MQTVSPCVKLTSTVFATLKLSCCFLTMALSFPSVCRGASSVLAAATRKCLKKNPGQVSFPPPLRSLSSSHTPSPRPPPPPVIEYDEDKTKILIKGTQNAVKAAAVLVRKFIFDELLPKRKLGPEELALVTECDKAGVHLNMNQLDTFSHCLKETYTLALKSFAAEDAQFSVLMNKQGIRWTWRRSDVEAAEREDVPAALALELERFFLDGSDGAVLCLPDTSSYGISLSAMSVCSRVDSSRYELHRSCAAPAPHGPRSASRSSAAAPTSHESDAKVALLSHRIMQFGFQHREITICLRNGCLPETDALISALADLQACTWLSNSAAQTAKKSGGASTSAFSGGLVPMFVKPPQDHHQKMQQPQQVGSRRPVVLDATNIALRHGALHFCKFADDFRC